MLFSNDVLPDIIIELILASVIFPRLTANTLAIEVIFATSFGCSAIIGFAPTARTALAQSFIDIGLVIQ